MKGLKKTTTATALFLILAMTITLVSVPSGNAQSVTVVQSDPYLGAIPNPVGVGQEVLLHVGITQQLNNVADGWEDLMVLVTKPDDTTTELGPYRTDSTGGTGGTFIPEEEGTYILQTYFPEQWYNYSRYGRTYSTLMKEGYSDELELIVQADPIDYYPGNPLPTEYWTRPIDSQLREWSVVAGNWLVTTPENKYVPYNEDAPDTAHILWTKELTSGGVAGGEMGDHGFEDGDAYQGKWSSRFIIRGMLIYTHHTSIRPLVYTAVDLHTGEEVWQRTFLDNRSISMAQLFYWDSYNYHGVYAYLWVTVGSTWYGFDPLDGTLRLTIENVPSGTTVVDPNNGGIYRYSISTRSNTLVVWNMSALISMEGSFLGPGHSTYDAAATTGSGALTSSAQRAYAYNTTIPEGLGSVGQIWHGDRFVGGSISRTEVTVFGVNLNATEGDIGELLFNRTWTAPASWEDDYVTVSGFGGGWMAWSQEDYVGVLWVKETREHYGFSLEDGRFMWGPTESQYYLDSVDDSASDVRNIAYGNLYCASVSGIVYCYNVTTGERQWTYEATDKYSEYLFANTWWMKPLFITDGKIYCGTTEHSPIDPKPRGGPCVCLNATTGDVVWRADGLLRQTRWGGRAIIGDSIMATMDTYDQRVYAVGKGASATTVTASPKVSVNGGSVIVEGMVTDVSPGTNDLSLTMRFPNGVPAVSDANMSEWMLYVYKQFAKPADIMGVDVTISVLDPNNNCYPVGTTNTTDGFFKLSFIPEVPGEYTIYATFSGSGAYYGSSAVTAINVENAPEATPAPSATPAPMTDTYVLGIGAASLAAIVAIGLVIILMLRKR